MIHLQIYFSRKQLVFWKNILRFSLAFTCSSSLCRLFILVQSGISQVQIFNFLGNKKLHEKFLFYISDLFFRWFIFNRVVLSARFHPVLRMSYETFWNLISAITEHDCHDSIDQNWKPIWKCKSHKTFVASIYFVRQSSTH